MKKFLFVAACLSLLSVFVSAQRATRPRIVTEQPKTQPPPSIKSDSSGSSARKPPVLAGSNRNLPPPPPLPEKPLEEDEEIIINTNLVSFPVTVLDRNGRFIPGLAQKDFQIFENGVQQKIEIFNSVEQPFTVILLLDMSNSTQFQINEIQDAAIKFVDQLRRDDKVMIASFDDTVHVLSQPTNNRSVLRNAILRTDFGGGTSLYEAVDSSLNQFLRGIEGRKAVVLFTDGVDTTSRRADYQTTLRDAEEADAIIYPLRYDTFADMNPNGGYGNDDDDPVSVLGDILSGGGIRIGRRRGGGGWGRGGRSGGGGSRGNGTSRSEYETGKRYLEDLARASGGRTYEASNSYNLDTAFASIAEELRRQYSIGYYPENAGQTGERKQIRVRVMRPNVVVRAKTSYIVGQGGSSFAGN